MSKCECESSDRKSSDCCQSDPCEGSSECCELHKDLLDLADQAWMELLKEKIKADIQAKSGEHLDKIAKLVSEANHDKWEHLIKGKVKCESYKTQLRQLLGGC